MNNIIFRYSNSTILNDVTLELNQSEIFGIIGPNGAGKSTLIRCINRILFPQSGDIRIGGTDVKTMDQMDIARNIGYVPQNSTNPFPATVFDTILMGRRPHGGWRSSKSDVKKALDILDIVGITDLAMRDFTELSGGQQQKVVLARALAQDSQILLLDEPTSNLDIRQQLETMEIVHSLVKREKISAIMAIHDLNLAARYADRILMLKNGMVFQIGEPFSVLTPDSIREVYGVESVVREEDGRPYIIPKCASIT